jgi:hypothetical protein
VLKDEKIHFLCLYFVLSFVSFYANPIHLPSMQWNK